MKYLKTFFSAFLSFVIFIVFLCIIPICFVPYFSGEETFWGTMGDYIGGIIGTIAALLVLMATREIINLQKQEVKETRAEFKKQSAIFNQQQFEETFFSLIKLLGEKQSEPIGEKQSKHTEKNNDNQQTKLDYHIVYGLIKEIIEMIENYRKECIKEDMSKEEKEHIKSEIYHYINILKLQVKDETHLYLLDRIMSYNETKLKEYFKQNHFCEFMDIEIIIKNIDEYEKYFGKDIFGKNKDFLRRKSQFFNLESKDYEELYKPDGKNITTDIVILKNLALAPKTPENILIELSQNHQQEELTEEDRKKIRQNVAHNIKAPVKALEILSQDKENLVREIVAHNGNTPENILNYLAINDKSDDVCVTALVNVNISTQVLNNELEKRYTKIGTNIDEIILIVLNNPKIYNDNTKFNKYFTKIIAYIEYYYDKGKNFGNEIRKLNKWFNTEIIDERVFKNIISISIDNILNNQYQYTCYLIVRDINIINKIHSYNESIWHIIFDKTSNIRQYFQQVSNLTREERKQKITSKFTEDENILQKLKTFISQLKEE